MADDFDRALKDLEQVMAERYSEIRSDYRRLALATWILFGVTVVALGVIVALLVWTVSAPR